MYNILKNSHLTKNRVNKPWGKPVLIWALWASYSELHADIYITTPPPVVFYTLQKRNY